MNLILFSTLESFNVIIFKLIVKLSLCSLKSIYKELSSFKVTVYTGCEINVFIKILIISL